MCLYPLLFNACWYGSFVLLNIVSFDDMLTSLLLMLSGIFFMILGGWLLFLCTYLGVLLSFMYGLYVPSLRFCVTSRKFVDLKFAFIVILSLWSLKI